jgi:hypothetical protein
MGSLNDRAIDIFRTSASGSNPRSLTVNHPPYTLLQDPRSGDRSNHQFPGSRIRCPSGITANIVTRVENGADAKQSTMDRLQRALEAAGVEFTNGDQPGVRLTKVAAAHSVGLTKGVQSKGVAKTVRGKTTKTTEKKG